MVSLEPLLFTYIKGMDITEGSGFVAQWRIQRGFQPPPPSFYISHENDIILSEIKLFHFCGIFKKNEIKSAKLTPSFIYELRHEISNNADMCASKASDQPAHMRSLIRVFASGLNIL